MYICFYYSCTNASRVSGSYVRCLFSYSNYCWAISQSLANIKPKRNATTTTGMINEERSWYILGREYCGILTYPPFPTSQVNGSHKGLLVSEGTIQTLSSKDPGGMSCIRWLHKELAHWLDFVSSAWETSWRGQQGRFYQHHLRQIFSSKLPDARYKIRKGTNRLKTLQRMRLGREIHVRTWARRTTWIYVPGNLEDYPYMPRAGCIFRKGQEDTRMVTTQWPLGSRKAGSEG